MASNRLLRVEEEIKRESADILRHMKDPRLGFVSVTGVKVTPDLQQARIYVSVLGTPEEEQATLEVLENAAGFVRTEIGHRVRLRRTPAILFTRDESMAYGAHMDAVMRSIAEKETKSGDPGLWRAGDT
ncbi:MAG: 30S ribosome-binding factor RbfA [Firmicutes bacterium]|nr:30S ribosome-binding factor RbfA [Bacillota bacterium]